MSGYIELAHRALACKQWRWMPGMLRIVPPEHDGATGYMIRVADSGWNNEERGFPDLTDPATLGCLLALVREAWPGTFVIPYEKKPGWWVAIMPAGPWPEPGPTEAEALVAALEAAP